MTAKHIMVDLETLSSDPTAAIIQIGAVSSDKSAFCTSIKFESALEYGEASGSTLEWWLSQSEAARESLFKNQVNMKEAMREFEYWVKSHSNAKTCFWSHATFDFPIIQRVSKLVLGHNVLPYKRLLDLRTIEYFYSEYIEWDERAGVHHNALDDAKYQMIHLMKMLDVANKKGI